SRAHPWVSWIVALEILWRNGVGSSTLRRMTPQVRLRWLGGLLLVGPAAAGSGGCAPECYDDGLFQGGCPGADTDSHSGTGSAGSESGGDATTNPTGGGDDSMMTADGESGGSSSGGPAVCPSFDQDLDHPTRTFHFVVEQSDAMDVAFDGGTRWSSVEDALVHPVLGVVTQQQSLTRFGLTSYRGLQAGCPQQQTVPPRLDARNDISAVMSMELPGGSNPVADTVDDVVIELNADAWMGDKTIVLLTADEPATCAQPSPGNAMELAQTRDAALMAVIDAFAAGYPTVVVSMGEDIAENHLQELANAGV